MDRDDSNDTLLLTPASRRLLADLDALAKERGMDRAKLVRTLLDDAVRMARIERAVSESLAGLDEPAVIPFPRPSWAVDGHYEDHDN